ncbi:paraslipin [Saccharobesus litoralis]|uniref:Paraslipin n=1 Tax=Saccharobesus litoralis TaxID=2172099 RepID=A0A2S0VWL7_9ALTE|nr:slipin family protein [Saccharobesus litoralis]AWB68573.1 paraslipin [Saccharobesus litoralis]
MNEILESIAIVPVAAIIFVLVTLKASIKFVPQNRAWIIERFGKYQSTKEAGLNFIIPFLDKVSADRSLKEQAFDVPSQAAITKDNISLTVDGVLYFRVLDPYKATYGVEDYIFAVTQLAQTTMRSEIGKIDLDKTFEERDSLNARIVTAINEASETWGVVVLRYEIKDITPPNSIMNAMESQMKAERERRAKILESEGEKQAAINIAEGEKQARVLAAEAEKQEQVLNAEGEAKAIVAVADAQAQALKVVGEAAATSDGQKAVELDLATKAIAAKQAIAKESSVVLLPDNSTEASSIVAQATSIISALQGSKV